LNHGDEVNGEWIYADAAAHDPRDIEEVVDDRRQRLRVALSMPVMDGWEALRHLRADERRRRIPIIACTGQDLPRKTPEPAADVVLVKPCPEREAGWLDYSPP